VHGATAITAITAQNTLTVKDVEAVSPYMIVAQVRAVVEDLGVDAVKIGMLGSVATTEAVSRALDHLPAGTPVVLDPVMVAESGARLLDIEAEQALIDLIVPRATVVTPNLPEARFLARQALDGERLARAVHALGPGAVVVTGGHRDEAIDVLFDGETVVELAGERHADGAAHGSGCTHSATLAARLALGEDLETAAREAKRVASESVRDGLRGIGRGAGPVNALGIGARVG
jgi:hydroxymethylpyrimidine/phosphomethylpyrimidine kinase